MAFDAFKVVDVYLDENGKIHLTVQTKNMSADVFSRQFPSKLDYDWRRAFDPALIEKCMYLFKLYDIAPIISLNNELIEFSGHNKDVPSV